jgi:hypothetical protein
VRPSQPATTPTPASPRVSRRTAIVPAAWRRALVLLCGLVALLAVGVPAAFASRQRVFERSFGCQAGAVGCTVPDPYPLAAEPWSIAVDDATGALYVTDALNHRVQEFNSKGEFVLMFGKEVNMSAVLAAGSEAEKNVCTAASLDTCQPGVASTGAAGFESSPAQVMFVAVDNSTGPSSGDVYVADYVEHAAGNRVSKFTAAGGLVSGWGEGGELDGGGVKHPPAELPGPFGPIEGIAVDPSGNLWVADESVAFQFADEVTHDGETGFKTDCAVPVGPLPFGVAVDSHDDLYFLQSRAVAEVNSACGLVGQVNEPGEEGHLIDTYAAAVDPANDDLFVLDEPELYVPARVQLQRYQLGCTMLSKLSGCTAAETYADPHLTGESAHAHGLAVGPGEEKTVYVSDREHPEVRAFSVVTVPGVLTGEPSGVTATAATLNGTVNPAGVALEKCVFEYGETEAYGQTTPCEGSVPPDSSEHAVHASIVVVQGKTYHYRLVAFNANDKNEPATGGDVVFGPPLVDSEWSTAVTASSADVHALVSAQNLETGVRVEYGTGLGYGKESGPVELVAGGGEQEVSFALTGLAPGSVYHYRFVAENAMAPAAVDGPDRVFSSQGAGAFRLADSRAWELVSPVDRHGASPEPPDSTVESGEGVTQAAAGGSALTYLSDSPIEAEPAGYGEFDQVLAQRGAGGGWSSRDLGIAHAGTTNLSDEGREYEFFSEDLSAAVARQFGSFLALSPWASEQSPYLNSPAAGGFTPLVSGCPSLQKEEEGHPCSQAVAEHADVPQGTVFGGDECPPLPQCGPRFIAATPDGTHIVLHSDVGLVEGHGPGLYEWSDGTLRFLTEGTLGTAVRTNEGVGVARHAISNDGSRVVVSKEHHLYLLDLAGEKVVQLDAVEAGCPGPDECGKGNPSPYFQGASSDDSRIFFTDSQKLTAQAGSGEAGRDLYECRIVEDACVLSALTQAAGAQKAALGISEDGAWVYFAAEAVLGDGAEHGAAPATCSYKELDATCNVYVSHEGQIRFIATISSRDDPDYSFGDGVALQTARVSPNGQWLAFMSERSLTGYDNLDAASGQPDEEVYLYDAATGGLSCVSCDPTGARPHGMEYANIQLGSFKVWTATFSDVWVAGYLPVWSAFEEYNAIYQPRYLSDSGRLFFNSSDGLVPVDSNGQGDVYEWEPDGVGPEDARCAPAAASGSEVFKPAKAFEAGGQSGVEDAGCVALISSGTSAQESAFLDASETGSDVFFLTTSHLVRADVEGGLSVYDAHECTSVSPCLPAEPEGSPPCDTADSCRAAPTPQPEIYGAPASATFSGSGNIIPEVPARGPVTPPPPTAAQVRAKALAKALKACKKDHAKNKRVGCERAARKKYAAKSARSPHKASSGRAR